jgi:transcriptional regulator with XRE-family HTH domain
MTFGDRVRNYRKAQGLTQEALAKAIGVSKTTITGYELGYREPDVEKIKLLSDALGVTGDDLLNTGFSKVKKAPSVSDEAMRMARDYDKLDNWGRQAVRDLTDTELARMEDEARFMNGAMLEDEPKVINLYAEPAAAGIAVPTMGVDFEPYTLKPDDPQGAAFAVRLQGDSMEPYFPDGSIVFVNHDAMVNGDIGIFCVDSGTVCKQYYHDPLGMVYLFSLNRDRSDADVVLGPSSNRTLICQGRVITKRRFPIPM